jgi:hypothetical protein
MGGTPLEVSQFFAKHVFFQKNQHVMPQMLGETETGHELTKARAG